MLVSHRVQDCGRTDDFYCFDRGNNVNKTHVFSKREFYDLVFLSSIFMFFLPWVRTPERDTVHMVDTVLL